MKTFLVCWGLNVIFFVIPIIIIFIIFILNNLAIGIDNKLKSNVYSTSHLKSSINIVNQTNLLLTSYKAQQKILNIEKARNDLWMHSFKFFLEDLSCSCSHLVRRFGWIRNIWRWIDNLVWATCLLQIFHMFLLVGIFFEKLSTLFQLGTCILGWTH